MKKIEKQSEKMCFNSNKDKMSTAFLNYGCSEVQLFGLTVESAMKKIKKKIQ